MVNQISSKRTDSAKMSYNKKNSSFHKHRTNIYTKNPIPQVAYIDSNKLRNEFDIGVEFICDLLNR